MSIMDELKKLTRPYDDDSELIDDDVDLDGMDEPVYTRPVAPQTQPQPQVQPQIQPQPQPQPQVASPVEPVMPLGGMNTMGAMNMGISSDIAKYRVVLVQPEKFDVATTIASHLRQGDAVVLNCENTDKDVARRVVDFLSGCAYALDGSIKKAANNVYILVPSNVGVDDAQEDEEA